MLSEYTFNASLVLPSKLSTIIRWRRISVANFHRRGRLGVVFDG